jgi:spore coat protein A
MMQVSQKLHRDLPPTQVWGYAGMYPGPSFEVRRGQPIAVKWINNLPHQHLLHNAIDPTLEEGRPEVRTVVHLHGGKTLPEYDGHPEAWFTPGFAQKGPFPTDEVYIYGNDQPAAMLWYHDHAMAITRLNVIAGLAGSYFIREAGEESLRLPRGRYEIPLVIQDKRFNPDGSIWYPMFGIPGSPHPVWNPDYFGDVALVNGKVMPYLEVEPRLYRLRILNAANSRFFNLQLKVDSSPGPAFVQIGADVGFLAMPVPMQSLLLSNAERADVVVDFSAFAGRNIVMMNDAPHPFPFGFPGGPPENMPVMQFRVRRKVRDWEPDRSRDWDKGRDRSQDWASNETRIPAVLPAPHPVDVNAAVLTRDIEIGGDTMMVPVPPGVCPFEAPVRMLVEGRGFMEPVITEPTAGTTEIWRFINPMFVAHPMHVHLAHMRVIDRQPFDAMAYMHGGAIIPLGPPQPAAPNELTAPKDTVLVGAAELTRVAVRFDLPSGTPVTLGQKFQYVHHCHMLEHEDNDMMRPFNVVVR